MNIEKILNDMAEDWRKSGDSEEEIELKKKYHREVMIEDMRRKQLAASGDWPA